MERQKKLAGSGSIIAETDFILQENARIEKAKKWHFPVMVDRLKLDAKRIEGIVEGVRQVFDFKTRLPCSYTN